MRSLPALLIAAGLFASGCSTQTAAPTAVATARTDGDHDHDHDHDHGHDHSSDGHTHGMGPSRRSYLKKGAKLSLTVLDGVSGVLA